jgi:hypothetical protein
MHLYIDDSGSRDPDHEPSRNRQDGMDYFALGGILMNEEDVDALYTAHKVFCEQWGINYPLHSWAIRGGREDFGWLKKPEAAFAFLSSLEQFIVGLPILGIATVIDRPGYVARYKEKHKDDLWFMCKTAYCILIERAAKYAASHGRQLRVFHEECGKREDRDLLSYHKALKKDGMPFDAGTSGGYRSLSAAQFRDIVLGEPKRKSKKVPMIQVADLVLYPMAKAGYDPTYRPYVALMEKGKLIDAVLAPQDRPLRGIKYSCFDKKPAAPAVTAETAKART